MDAWILAGGAACFAIMIGYVIVAGRRMARRG